MQLLAHSFLVSPSAGAMRKEMKPRTLYINLQTTKLTEHFGFDEFLEKHKQLVARLFEIESKE